MDVDLPNKVRVTDHRVSMSLPDEMYQRFSDVMLEYFNQRAEEEAGEEGHEGGVAREPTRVVQGPPTQAGEASESPQVRGGDCQSPETREVTR